MSPSVARLASREGQREQVPADFNAPKPKPPARNAGRKLRFPSSRHKAGPFIAANVFKRGERWDLPLNFIWRETLEWQVRRASLRPDHSGQVDPDKPCVLKTNGPSILNDRRAAVFSGQVNFI